MRTPFLAAVAMTALLMPFQSAAAATPGGFKVGQTFKLKVLKVTSTRKVGYFGTETTAPVPAGVPKYLKNQIIEFKIGTGGRLTAKGLSIPFAHGSATMNEYNLYKPGKPVSVTHNAEINKAAGKATGGTLSFFITNNAGSQPVFRTVVYQID
jgi:hypothetical protein